MSTIDMQDASLREVNRRLHDATARPEAGRVASRKASTIATSATTIMAVPVRSSIRRPAQSARAHAMATPRVLVRPTAALTRSGWETPASCSTSRE